MRFSLLVLFAAVAVHAANVDSETPPSPVDDPEESPTLFQKAFPELQSTSEMMGYVSSLTQYALNFPFSLLEQSDKFFTERIQVEEKCIKGQGLTQTSMAASEADAYRYARYAAAAYCIKPSVLTEWNCKHHCTDASTAGTAKVTVVEDKLSGIKFFTGINRQRREVIVSFRGTLVIAALFVDAAFAQEPYDKNDHPKAPEGAMVHAGFKYAYKRVAAKVRKHVQEFLKTNMEEISGYTVHVTGHSMGGSIALLAALDLAAQNILPVERISLYTYGQPRTGNLDFADWVSTLKWKHLTRVTANSDLIAHLPPSSLDYYHHRGEMYLNGYWIENEKSGSTWSSIASYVRNALGYEPTVTLCKDQFCESAEGTNSRFPWLNVLHHLRYFNITIGPWC